MGERSCSLQANDRMIPHVPNSHLGIQLESALEWRRGAGYEASAFFGARSHRKSECVLTRLGPALSTERCRQQILQAEDRATKTVGKVAEATATQLQAA